MATHQKNRNIPKRGSSGADGPKNGRKSDFRRSCSMYSGFERRRTTLIELSSRSRRRHSSDVLTTAIYVGSLFITTTASISCVVMGALYWATCPGNAVLPVIFVLKLPLTCTEFGATYIILARNYEWVRKLVRGQCMSKIHTATGFLFILTGLWFSLTAFWVFENNVSYNSSHDNYCDPHFHKFALGFVIIFFVILGLLIVIFVLGCLLLAITLLINSRLKGGVPDMKRKPTQSVHYGETSFFLPSDEKK